MRKEKGDQKMSIGEWLIIIIGGMISIPITLYMVLSFPVMIVWKIYRKVKYKEPIIG